MKEQIAPYKYPRWIEFVDELPKTATGKIQRFKLRTSILPCTTPRSETLARRAPARSPVSRLRALLDEASGANPSGPPLARRGSRHRA